MKWGQNDVKFMVYHFRCDSTMQQYTLELPVLVNYNKNKKK